MKILWRRFLAYWRLDLGAVCEMSRDLPADADYHDYPDSTVGAPFHFYTHHRKHNGGHPKGCHLIIIPFTI